MDCATILFSLCIEMNFLTINAPLSSVLTRLMRKKTGGVGGTIHGHTSSNDEIGAISHRLRPYEQI